MATEINEAATVAENIKKLPQPATGFLVKAELRMSPGKGIGVFADEFIPANQKVYESKPVSYSEKEALILLNSMKSLQAKGSLVGACLRTKR